MADGFSPPAQVRSNAARSLELRRKFGRGMTAVGVARARDLSNGKNISADTIKRMHSYFARHEVDKKGKDWANASNPSAGYIAWLGWGGDAGRSWVNGIIKKLEAKESQETPTMASTKAATIRGIFLKPGLSKNRRLYTRGNIAKAVERMRSQIENGEGMPLNMATSHGAAFKDDAMSTVARVTDVWLNKDGSAGFEADVANTANGRDLASLAVGKFIKGVSIRGEWRGEPRAVTHSDGEEATTAEDLAIHGIDFTNSPGVEGAEIQYAALAESYTKGNSLAIFESIEPVEIVSRDETIVAKETASLILDAISNVVEDARLEIEEAVDYANIIDRNETEVPANMELYKDVLVSAAAKFKDIHSPESTKWTRSEYAKRGGTFRHRTLVGLESTEAAKSPYGNVAYADPGYQKDKVKRYPINGAGHVRAAWSYINQPKNAKLYTAAQLARIKSRIKSAAKKFGVNIVSEHAQLVSDFQEILEAYASIALVNDDDSISITGYATDPHQLKVVANRIAFGAIAAMHAIDPDDDGDIYLSKPDWSQVDATGDAGGMGPEDEEMTTDDNNMECEHCGAVDCPAEAVFCHMCGEALRSPASSAGNQCAVCGTECHEDAIHCHMCGEALPKSMTDNALGCGNCGETTPQDAMYCPTCGDPVPQAESTDNAPIQNKENEEMSDENATVADETPAEETAVESTTARTLSDADLQALAALIMGAKATENTEEEVAVEVTPEAEVAAEEPAVDAEEVVEEPAAEAEESHESKEISVSENKMFSAEEVAAMVAEAAQSAATAAVEKATSNAIESYRTGRVFRKGLSASAVGTDASDLSEAELTPEALAEMNSSNFRKVQSETWGSHPFFAAKFAQAERGF
jgi:hypothetical protein